MMKSNKRVEVVHDPVQKRLGMKMRYITVHNCYQECGISEGAEVKED